MWCRHLSHMPCRMILSTLHISAELSDSMDNRIRIAAICAAVAFSIWVLTSPSNPLPIPEPLTGGPNDSVIIVAQNLERPRDIAAHQDEIFLVEREGRIKLVREGVVLENTVATLRPAEDFDAGLLGIAVHPLYDTNGLLYVYITYREDNMPYNRIMEIRVVDDRLADAKTLLEGIPGSRFTNGGAIEFGPDGMLYIGTGTPSESSHLPQDIESLAGKILRINSNGTIPPDNPFDNSVVYSIGHRSVKGLAWDVNGIMYAIESGPDKNDEINRIEAGENYGWPYEECSGEYRDAILCYDPAIEPGGIIFASGASTSPGYLVISSLRTSSLFEVDIQEGLSSQKIILGGVGRIRDVAESSDGILYVITSNTDGKGFPGETDDMLLMIRP